MNSETIINVQQICAATSERSPDIPLTVEYREHHEKKMREIRDPEAEEEELPCRNPQRHEKRRIA